MLDFIRFSLLTQNNVDNFFNNNIYTQAFPQYWGYYKKQLI